MVDFAKLKAMSGKKGLEALTKELEKMTDGTKRYGDDRFWKPTVDKAGNGYAIIRFLPVPEENKPNFVSYWDHGFQGPTGLWYIEKSLTSIGKADPVSDFNSKLWNSNKDDDSSQRKQARKQKRRLHYVSNIYVITDSGNQANEGKTFLYAYGKKIFEKIKEKVKPQFPGEVPMNAFDLWEGANFEMKIRNEDGYRSYGKSDFSKSGPLFDDDKKIESVLNKCLSLDEFLDASKYKTYDELNSQLIKVLGDGSSFIPRAEQQKLKEEQASPPKLKEKEANVSSPPLFDADSEEDDELKFFEKLASK